MSDLSAREEIFVEALRDVLWASVMVVGYGSEDHRCRFCDCRAPDLVRMKHSDNCVINDVLNALHEALPSGAPATEPRRAAKPPEGAQP
jgi:hypothetical protein